MGHYWSNTANIVKYGQIRPNTVVPWSTMRPTLYHPAAAPCTAPPATLLGYQLRARPRCTGTLATGVNDSSWQARTRPGGLLLRLGQARNSAFGLPLSPQGVNGLMWPNGRYDPFGTVLRGPEVVTCRISPLSGIRVPTTPGCGAAFPKCPFPDAMTRKFKYSPKDRSKSVPPYQESRPSKGLLQKRV